MIDKNMEAPFQKFQQGSGSAENKGESRDNQKTKTHLSEKEKKDIADQTGLEKNDIESIAETGALSGRDDQASGSGDQMTATNSNEPTPR